MNNQLKCLDYGIDVKKAENCVYHVINNFLNRLQYRSIFYPGAEVASEFSQIRVPAAGKL